MNRAGGTDERFFHTCDDTNKVHVHPDAGHLHKGKMKKMELDDLEETEVGHDEGRPTAKTSACCRTLDIPGGVDAEIGEGDLGKDAIEGSQTAETDSSVLRVYH